MWVFRNKIGFGVATTFLLLQGILSAASLNPETLKAWDAYVQGATDRMQQRLQPGQHFLWADEEEDRISHVRGGEPYIAPTGPQNPKKVPNGLIHDWVGTVFIPDTKI